MGLNAALKDWKRQTKYFGHLNGSKYSCLVFDNRGVGRSDKPTCFYSTSEMARDVVDLVSSLGWIDMKAPATRAIHVIGASMGGMGSRDAHSRPARQPDALLYGSATRPHNTLLREPAAACKHVHPATCGRGD